MKKTIFDIKLSRTLLEKNEKTLSKLEKEAVAYHKEQLEQRAKRFQEENERLTRDCKILCSGSETELIPAYGWITPVKEMAYDLEKLNLFYKKYRMKVVFDQVKEKFGTFRGYWSIAIGHRGAYRHLANICDIIANMLDKVNYGITRVEDVKSFIQLKWEECEKDEYDKRLDRCGKKIKNCKLYNTQKLVSDEPIYIDTTPPDVVYFKESEGKYFRSYYLHTGPKSHYEITKHKILYKIKNICNNLSSFIDATYVESAEENVMYEAFYNEVTRIVNRCETNCYEYCEACGTMIGERGLSSRCETTGWISYVCDKCAAIRGGVYYNTKSKTWMNEYTAVENPYKKVKKT